MKALTVHQPRAQLIRIGVKRIETRSWPAPAALIGERIAIHETFVWGGPFGAVACTARLVACLPIETPDSKIARRDLMLWTSGAGDLVEAMYRPDDPEPDGHPWITVARHDDQLPLGDFTPGRWGWMLDDVELVDPPAPARGRQGLWDWTPPEEGS